MLVFSKTVTRECPECCGIKDDAASLVGVAKTGPVRIDDNDGVKKVAVVSNKKVVITPPKKVVTTPPSKEVVITGPVRIDDDDCVKKVAVAPPKKEVVITPPKKDEVVVVPKKDEIVVVVPPKNEAVVVVPKNEAVVVGLDFMSISIPTKFTLNMNEYCFSLRITPDGNNVVGITTRTCYVWSIDGDSIHNEYQHFLSYSCMAISNDTIVCGTFHETLGYNDRKVVVLSINRTTTSTITYCSQALTVYRPYLHTTTTTSNNIITSSITY